MLQRRRSATKLGTTFFYFSSVFKLGISTLNWEFQLKIRNSDFNIVIHSLIMEIRLWSRKSGYNYETPT